MAILKTIGVFSLTAWLLMLAPQLATAADDSFFREKVRADPGGAVRSLPR